MVVVFGGGDPQRPKMATGFTRSLGILIVRKKASGVDVIRDEIVGRGFSAVRQRFLRGRVGTGVAHGPLHLTKHQGSAVHHC